MAQAIDEQVHDWLDNMPAGKTANWVVRKRFRETIANNQENARDMDETRCLVF